MNHLETAIKQAIADIEIVRAHTPRHPGWKPLPVIQSELQAALDAAYVKPEPPKPKSFTVVCVSSNTNSFGLKSIILLADDGESWQILKSPYGGDKLPEQGDTVRRVGGRFNCGTYECPTQLHKVSPADASKILKEVRKLSGQ